MARPWFYEFVLPLLPTVLTIIGWWIVDKRERSKRQKDWYHNRINTAIEIIDELQNLSIDYCRKDEAECLELGHEINFSFQKLSRLCDKIERGGKVQQAFQDFKLEVSGGDFQNAKRLKLKPESRKFLLIRKKAFDLRQLLDDLHDD